MFHIVGNSGDSRKRRREIDMSQLMSLLHHQQQFQNQNVDVSTGLRLSFNDHQQLQHQHSLSSQSSVLSLLSHDLSTQITHQRNEIEHFIQIQVNPTSKNHIFFLGFILYSKK